MACCLNVLYAWHWRVFMLVPVCWSFQRRENCYDEQWCDCFPYGEDVLAEIMGDTWGGSDGAFVPFREYNIPSRDFGKGDSKTMDPATLKLAQARGCAAAVVDHAIEARRGSTIACNNDGSPGSVNGSAGFGPGPYGNLTYLEQHRIVSSFQSPPALRFGSTDKSNDCCLRFPVAEPRSVHARYGSWLVLWLWVTLDGQRLALLVPRV